MNNIGIEKAHNRSGICFITFSDNCDHQEAAFSIFNELYPDYNVYNIGIICQKYDNYPKTERSFYFKCPKRPGISKGMFNFFEIIKIVKTIKKMNVKYVFFESNHLWNAIVMKMIPKAIIKVQVIHDVIPHSDSKGMRLSNKWLCKISDYIVLRNFKYKKDLVDVYKVKDNKIINLPVVREFPEYDFKTPFEKRFLFFGRIRKYKGIDSFIQIARKCIDLKFDIVGSPNRETIEYIPILKSLPNVNVVDKEVSNEEMRMYFKNTMAVILPYSSATQSGVIVDAYKYAKPVIAFNVGAIVEQVSEGESGFLIEDANIELFSKKLYEINNMSKDSLIELGKKAYLFGKKKYSAESNKKVFIDFFLMNSLD